MPDRTRNIIIP